MIMPQTAIKEPLPFGGCKLSIHLNGSTVMTIEEGNFIKDILSFIALKEQKEKEVAQWNN